MVPNEDHVQGDKPLLAAASILKLRQAYLVLKGEQRQVIAQVYQELFGPDIPLGMA